MHVRGMVGKAVAFGVVAISCIVGGILVFYGPHAYNDYFNAILGGFLVLAGLGAAGIGTLLIAGDVLDARQHEREQSLHITPRPGPLGPPPPWGMGDVGRVGGSVRDVGGGAGVPRGGGGARLMAVTTSNWDAPLAVGLLIVWSVVALILWAPR